MGVLIISWLVREKKVVQFVVRFYTLIVQDGACPIQ